MGYKVALKGRARLGEMPGALTRADYPFRITIPCPPSINALFGQAPGKKRYPLPAYKVWQEEAEWLLKQQRPPHYPAQVWLSITYPDSGRFDLDNRLKPIPDLLKKCGVIVDDTRRYVRCINLSWGDVSGALVEISPFPLSQTASV